MQVARALANIASSRILAFGHGIIDQETWPRDQGPSTRDKEPGPGIEIPGDLAGTRDHVTEIRDQGTKGRPRVDPGSTLGNREQGPGFGLIFVTPL